MLFKKRSPETSKALSVGFSSFIMNLSEAFPMFALQKFILSVADHVGRLNSILTLFNIEGRLYVLTVCVMYAFDSSFLPAASHAFGKRSYRRLNRLLIHAMWVLILWASMCTAIMIGFSSEIVSLFVNDQDVLDAAVELIPYNFATLPVYVVHTVLISYLQATKRSTRATVFSLLTTLVPLPVYAPIVYTLFPNSLDWIYSSYIFSDVVGFLVTVFGSITTLRKMNKLKDGEEFPPEKKCCCSKPDTNENATISTTTSINSIAEQYGNDRKI